MSHKLLVISYYRTTILSTVPNILHVSVDVPLFDCFLLNIDDVVEMA